jgi:hypothetical protein
LRGNVLAERNIGCLLPQPSFDGASGNFGCNLLVLGWRAERGVECLISAAALAPDVSRLGSGNVLPR